MIILCGPSASGKTEIVKELVNKYSYKKLVTYTTRDKRVGEIDHVDYHFVTKDFFENGINNNYFFEYIFYNGNYYGTAFEDITDEKVVILEPTGFNKYYEAHLKNTYSFFLYSSREFRLKRMIERGDSKESIDKRLISDETAFGLDKVSGIDYILNSNDVSIQELAKEINEVYKLKLKNTLA